MPISMYNRGHTRDNNTKVNNMTHKIISLAIDTLIAVASKKGNNGEFNRDMDDAIKALKKVAKYF